MHFLNTDTLTHAHLGHRKVASRIERAGEQNVATTIVTAIEIIRGRHEYIRKAADGAQLLRAQQLLNASEEMLTDIQIVRVDATAAAEFDRLRQICVSRLDDLDMEAAGIAPAMGSLPDITQHRTCVNDRPPCLHHVCTDLVPREWRGHTMFSLLSSTIHGLIASPTTTSSATAMGNLKRRGPALPGLT
jgi:predicted nucleic acid-binding protein